MESTDQPKVEMENYTKLSILARGGFGTVTLCRSVTNNEMVVLKEIPLNILSDDAECEAIQNEVKILTMLHYPHIIGYYSSFLNCNTLNVVIEYASHGTLKDYLTNQNGELLTQDDVLLFFCQLLLSVNYIHKKNILHRDIKPQNILLTGCNGKLVKLGDFGLSKLLDSSWNKATSVVGTLCYMAPELCQGQPYGKHCDIWSLGCVFYNILTLKPAFDGTTLAVVLNKILHGTISNPVDRKYEYSLAELVSNMLNRDQDQRPTVSAILSHHLITPFTYELLVDFGIIFNDKTNY